MSTEINLNLASLKEDKESGILVPSNWGLCEVLRVEEDHAIIASIGCGKILKVSTTGKIIE